MLIKTNIIVLNKLKYKDYDLIIRTYTEHRGAVSYIAKNALKPSKTNKVKSVYFQPLMQLSIEENYRSNQSLQYFKDVKSNYIYQSLHTNVYKSAIVLFLSELLAMVLREEEQNKDLYHFLETAFQYLDTEEHFANFHLLFLLKLTRYLGFQPDMPNENSKSFNLQTGSFEAYSKASYSVSGKSLTLLKRLLGINFDELNTIKINAAERHDFLNMLLYYFELHLGDFKKPKSLKVLSEIFR
ncbi:DNA repair protein RecO [Winogradskyella immobilis]|uniref:DNA repair protein RecO n=1 Tax=Winogradskyella immobilis TaxID=2816852 RepID=A0ABS8EQF4_9FLAO|nr:DNA repair protein RecO [Winogradskyella immobilis]MCC1485474.1 DNA repair protein RecO [Winogradskyella immobilis]MCG0017566.1 DNA repair protein RecO [Winogradskyella immobilis]